MTAVSNLSYTEYLQLRTCGVKAQYTAEWVASNAAVALSWAAGVQLALEPYECRFCDYYHLGNPRPEDKKIRANWPKRRNREGN